MESGKKCRPRFQFATGRARKKVSRGERRQMKIKLEIIFHDLSFLSFPFFHDIRKIYSREAMFVDKN